MIGVVHDRQTDAGRSKSHHRAKSQINPNVAIQSADDEKIGNKVKTEHEDGLQDHFTIAVAADLMSLKIFVYAFCNGREELGKGRGKL